MDKNIAEAAGHQFNQELDLLKKNITANMTFRLSLGIFTIKRKHHYNTTIKKNKTMERSSNECNRGGTSKICVSLWRFDCESLRNHT